MFQSFLLADVALFGELGFWIKKKNIVGKQYYSYFFVLGSID